VPKVQLIGLDIFHMPVKPGDPDSPLDKIIAETDKIVLDYHQSVLTFHFAVLDFTSPNKNEHAFMLEKRVEERTRELAKLNATKDKLFSIISHDLRSPFNVILGYTDVLKEQYKSFDEETMDNVLSDLKESGENAFNLLENLLNWSSAQRGTIDFTPTKTTVAEITDNILPEVKSVAKKKNVEIINYVSGKNIPLMVDKNMLSLVFRNLLTNAIKFSHHGRRIWIDAKLKNTNEVVFSVKDEGIGIDPEKIETLFDLEKNTTQNGTIGEKGTGLGLILSKEFVEIHNGKIWVKSEPGKGSTFYFSVPEKIA
jgi:signal transduction histidine kinase